jgi:hypothetical protein
LCEDIGMFGQSLALLFTLLVPMQERAVPARATIADVGWLAGDWVVTQGRATIEERWSSAAGGAMLAVSRTIKDDRLAAFEYLRIIQRDGGLVYVAQPNGRPPTEFVLTAVTADSATFENPAHDFPKMIRYTRRSDGSLEARVSGSGGDRPQVFVFARQTAKQQ